MPAGGEGSVSRVIRRFHEGDPAAFEDLWGRFFARLVAVARRQLPRRGPAGADEEDVALSAFKSFHRRARRGDFPRLGDRDDLWVQLVTLTRQKAIDLRRREQAQKRGGDRVVREADLDGPGDPDREAGLAGLAGRDPDPAFAALMAEQCRLRLEQLGDETLRQVALAKLGLATHQEIAERFGRSLSWVNRKLDLIRSIWEAPAP